MSQLIIFAPALVLAVIFFRYQRKNGWHFGPISMIIVAYLVMSILAIVLHFLGKAMPAYELSAMPVIYLSGCFVIAFWGLSHHTDAQFRRISIENVAVYRLLELFLIVSSFVSIAFFVPFARNALTGDVDFNRQDGLYMKEALSSWGFLNTFCSLAANLFAFNIIFAFLNMCPGFGNGRSSKLRAILLLVGSTSQIFYVLAYVGRDGIFFWGLTLALAYLFLRNFISDHAKRPIKLFAYALVVISLIPFAVITISRFGASEAGLGFSILQYGGVQVQQFNDHFIGYSEAQWGRINFPILFRLLPLGDPYFNRFEWFELYTSVGVRPWTFSTYVGTFVQDVGPWIAPLLVGLIAITTRLSLRRVSATGTLDLSQVFVFILGAQIVLYGVFYFRQGIANSYVLAVLLIALLLRLSRQKRGGRLLMKRPDPINKTLFGSEALGTNA